MPEYVLPPCRTDGCEKRGKSWAGKYRGFCGACKKQLEAKGKERRLQRGRERVEATEKAIAEAVTVEREVCAQLALLSVHRKEYPACNCEFCELAEDIADAIRARGEKTPG